MTLQALAKVNLTLRVLDERGDGFHNIESLIVPISLADEVDVTITAGHGVGLRCDEPTIPCDQTNLAARAVLAFAEFTGKTFHAEIALRKRIPHGAGLGGGSSNAAAVLRGLDELLETQLSDGELLSLAAGLGSDVPFFIKSQSACCTGRGEILRPAHINPKWNLLLVKPPFAVPTGWAYQSFARGGPWRPAASVSYDAVELVNDLEPPVFDKYLQLPVLKAWLIRQPGVATAMMSGSGSTLFAVLTDEAPDLETQIARRFGETMWVHRCVTGG